MACERASCLGVGKGLVETKQKKNKKKERRENRESQTNARAEKGLLQAKHRERKFGPCFFFFPKRTRERRKRKKRKVKKKT
jgi:hypothetical protein